MSIIEFLEFYQCAMLQDNDEKIRDIWLAMLPQMDKYMPYQEFNDMMTGKNIDKRSTEEIIRDIEETHERELGKNGT